MLCVEDSGEHKLNIYQQLEYLDYHPNTRHRIGSIDSNIGALYGSQFINFAKKRLSDKFIGLSINFFITTFELQIYMRSILLLIYEIAKWLTQSTRQIDRTSRQ